MKTIEKYRVTRIVAKGKRRISWMNDRQLEKFRANRLRAIRKEELGLLKKRWPRLSAQI